MASKYKYRIRIDKERCKGCLLCVQACARGLIKLADKVNSRGQRFVEIEREEECRGCRQCAEICPEAGIEIDRTELPDVAPAPKGVAVAGGEGSAREAS